MLEHAQTQQVAAKVYRTPDRLMVAVPMPGLQPGDIEVEVTDDSRLILHGRLRGALKEQHENEPKDLLVDEWSIGPYHRELTLTTAVDADLANMTFGNGVLVVTLPVAEQTRPARLTLEAIGPAFGERVGSSGHPIRPTTTEEHLAAMASEWVNHGGRRTG